MKNLTAEEKEEIEALTKAYAAKCKVHPTKGKYDFNGSAQRAFSGSGSVSFSDTGDKAEFTTTDFSQDEETCFKELNPVEKCKRIVFNEEAKAQATGWAAKRNKQIRAAKEAIKRRFQFTYHDTKTYNPNGW